MTADLRPIDEMAVTGYQYNWIVLYAITFFMCCPDGLLTMICVQLVNNWIRGLIQCSRQRRTLGVRDFLKSLSQRPMSERNIVCSTKRIMSNDCVCLVPTLSPYSLLLIELRVQKCKSPHKSLFHGARLYYIVFI